MPDSAQALLRPFTPPQAKNGLPLAREAQRARIPSRELAAWFDANRQQFQDELAQHGALLFRGFAIDTPSEFEATARSAVGELKNDYLGTSPRDGLTDYVFSASELPGYYPIPQHCEMTFVAHPPQRLCFWCQVPSKTGGETPLVDFARVWAELDDAVKTRFVERGLRITRNYDGPPAPGQSASKDLWKLKRWDEMFGSTDKSVVESKARAEGFTPEWHGDRLTLTSEHSAMRPHPESDVPVWFNHSQVFHASTAAAELRRVAQYRGLTRSGLRGRFWWLVASALSAIKSREPEAQHPLACTYRDGQTIPTADMEHVRDTIWRNLVAIPWQAGDLVVIDNNRIGHGRLPYTGPRTVAVCWA